MTVGNTWPSLVSIKLRSAYVDADALLKFFERHKNTLTILSLRRVGLESDTPYTCLDVAQRGGQLLHLDYTDPDVYEWGMTLIPVFGNSTVLKRSCCYLGWTVCS